MIYAYIVNASATGGNTVSVVDTATNTVIATIPVGTDPQGVAFDNINCVTKIYIANTGLFPSAGNDTISVIDALTNIVTATIPVGKNPVGVLVVGLYLYVTNTSDNTISVIDITTNTVVFTIADGSFSGQQGIAVVTTSLGTFLYITNFGSNTVSVINVATWMVVDTITVGLAPSGIAVTPDGKFIYVANTGDAPTGTVSKIDVATNTVVATISVGLQPFGVTITPDGSKVYVVNNNYAGTGSVSVISTATDAVIATIPLAPFIQALGSAITPDGRYVYVTDNSTNDCDGVVDIIDTLTNTRVGFIQPGTFCNPVSFGLFIGTVCEPSPKRRRGGIAGLSASAFGRLQETICFNPNQFPRDRFPIEIFPNGCPPTIPYNGITYYYIGNNEYGQCCYSKYPPNTRRR